MAKKGGKKRHKKGGKKGGLEKAMTAGFQKEFGAKGRKHSNKRPLKLLKWARDRMKANLPKLESIIEQRQAAGER